MPGQRGSGHLAVLSDIRTLIRVMSSCEDGTNLRANHSIGAHVSQHLNLSWDREGSRAISQGQNRTRDPTVRDRRGLLGNVAYGGNRNPCRNRKGGNGHSPPKGARAQILPDSLASRRVTGGERSVDSKEVGRADSAPKSYGCGSRGR